MTRDERIATAIESLEAIRDGKTLQQKSHGVWVDLSSEDWLRNAEAIRIKPEPILRPWTEAEAFAVMENGTLLRKKGTRSAGRLNVRVTGEYAVGGTPISDSCDLCGLMQKFIIAATGEPCGVYETPTV